MLIKSNILFSEKPEIRDRSGGRFSKSSVFRKELSLYPKTQGRV